MSKNYTCEEVATKYGVKVDTVWLWIREKKMNAILLGKKYSIRQIDLDQFENDRMTIKE